MAETYTSNLGLVKPDYDSPADISVINSNMDKIDNAVANAGKVKSVNGKTGDVVIDDVSKLNGKDSVYYLGARNLLDNSDFRNPVNQRGATTVENGFIVDRWYTFNNNQSGGATLTPSGITLSGNGYLQQRLPKGILQTDKPYTVAVYFSDGTADVGTNGVVIFSEDFDFVNNVHANGKTISHVALYEGSYTAENLPPYTPKGYAAELAECSRWYTCGTLQTARPFAMGSNTMAYLCDVKYPVPMEVEHLPAKQPTVNISNVKIWVNQSDAGVSAVKNIGDNTGFNSVNLSAGLSDAVIQFDYEASADL